MLLITLSRFCRRVTSATSADELNHVRKIAYNYAIIGIDEGQFVSSIQRCVGNMQWTISTVSRCGRVLWGYGKCRKNCDCGSPRWHVSKKGVFSRLRMLSLFPRCVSPLVSPIAVWQHSQPRPTSRKCSQIESSLHDMLQRCCIHKATRHRNWSQFLLCMFATCHLLLPAH